MFFYYIAVYVYCTHVLCYSNIPLHREALQFPSVYSVILPLCNLYYVTVTFLYFEKRVNFHLYALLYYLSVNCKSLITITFLMLYYEVRCDYLSVYFNDTLRYFGAYDNLLPICELYYVTVTFLYSEKRYSGISISLYYY